MKTYNDLFDLGENQAERLKFILDAIREHERSNEYKNAVIAKDYAEGRNATIMQYQKILYTLTGQAVPDNYSANHKCASGFFKRFVTQETSYLLGNGVQFTEESTKEKLGANFDNVLYKLGKSALIQAVAFGFYNKDHIEVFDYTEFVPLWNEETGGLEAGIRYWQLDKNKPLRATLYEIDGYTDYIKRKDEDISELHEKRKYNEIVAISEADGEEIIDGENYNGFPIVPLWANSEKQSELVGRREQIDCYDLIKSGFANDLDDASMIYWTLQNAGGMDDIDLVKFVERMKTVKAAVVGDEDGARAEAHTIDIPYRARERALNRLEKDLYKDFMALDVEIISAGNITATQIEAAYEPLNQKTDEFEMCVIDFIDGILALAGIEDKPTFTRSQISNRNEKLQNLLQSAEYIDSDTITEQVLILLDMGDKYDDVIAKLTEQETARFDKSEVTV